MLRAVVLTQYRRLTDRQTAGIAIASTALAMRALWHAVKMFCLPAQAEKAHNMQTVVKLKNQR